MYGWAKLRFLSPIPFNPKKGKNVKCGLIVMGDLPRYKTWRIGRIVMGDLPRKMLVRAQRRTQKEVGLENALPKG